MKKSILKHRYFFRIFLIVLTVLTVIIVNSCRKDVNQQKQTKGDAALTKHKISIADLKKNYYTGIGSGSTNRFTTADVSQQTLAYIIGSLNVNWSTYTTTTYPDSTQVVEFSIPDDSTLLVPGSLASHDSIKYHSKTTAVFILRQDTINMSFFMKTVEDCSATGYQSVIKQLYYKQVPPTFNGNIYYFTLARQFINGYQWQNGTPVNTVSLSASTVQTQAQAGNKGRFKSDEIALTNCTTVGYGVYNVMVDANGDIISWQEQVGTINVTTCTITESGGTTSSTTTTTSGGGGGVAGDPSKLPPPCVTQPAAVEVRSDKGRFINDVAAGGSSGGSTGGSTGSTTTPCSTSEKITNDVQNPCLRSMVQATISGDVTNKINTIIQNVFGSSNTMNITFVDVSTLPSNADGFTNNNGGIVNGVLNTQIQLDNNHLPGYSQQYIARVIMHEALHAYLTANGTSESQQHESMIINYVTQMAGALQQMFPGLSDSDAKNLALGGLQLTSTFQTTIENDMALSGSFVATNMAYSIGSLGLRCK